LLLDGQVAEKHKIDQPRSALSVLIGATITADSDRWILAAVSDIPRLRKLGLISQPRREYPAQISWNGGFNVVFATIQKWSALTGQLTTL